MVCVNTPLYFTVLTDVIKLPKEAVMANAQEQHKPKASDTPSWRDQFYGMTVQMEDLKNVVAPLLKLFQGNGKRGLVGDLDLICKRVEDLEKDVESMQAKGSATSREEIRS